MSEPQPARRQSDLAEMIEMLLDKGLVINADVVVSVGETELLGIHIRAAIASFETAARYGLEFPEGTDMKRLEAAAEEDRGRELVETSSEEDRGRDLIEAEGKQRRLTDELELGPPGGWTDADGQDEEDEDEQGGHQEGEESEHQEGEDEQDGHQEGEESEQQEGEDEQGEEGEGKDAAVNDEGDDSNDEKESADNEESTAETAPTGGGE